MTNTRITHESRPDPVDPEQQLYTLDGQHLGTLRFEKNTSRLELAPDQPPWRTWPLKRKYRQR